MKTLRLLLAAAVLAAASPANARLLVMYFGDQDNIAFEIDGQDYTVGKDGLWLDSIGAGAHEIGADYSGTVTITLDGSNAAPPVGDEAPIWCLEVDEDGYELYSSEDCDEALYYM
ncbi:MAG TPA: hypothetical protein VF138_03965 [Caulobacteraceae bacterium]